MRTARLLIIYHSIPCISVGGGLHPRGGGGVCFQGSLYPREVYIWGAEGLHPGGVGRPTPSLPTGCWADPPWTDKHLWKLQGLFVPFACAGSSDPVRVLCLFHNKYTGFDWSIYCWDYVQLVATDASVLLAQVLWLRDFLLRWLLVLYCTND